ncbi:sugar O-acetyltransferase [Xylophilus sp. Kf1]|nr:sugar O-acetyltransferase [Xylophilus sp. Kf1]
MTEFEKAAAGLLYDANHDPELLARRQAAKELLFDLNHLHPREQAARDALLRRLLGRTGRSFVIESPFHCDYGSNVTVGENFYANVNLVILDGAPVTIGDNVFIAPNVGIHTAGHPLDAERRNAGLEYARPVSIGDDVWIGASVVILPGVRIGAGAVIGAGTVVRHDVPAGVVYAGNPGRVVREIGDADRAAGAA